jgi:hypothetical protein
MSKLRSTKSASPRKPISTRFLFTEQMILQAMATKFTGGNVSEWIRYAALNFKPAKKDLK